MTPAVRDEIIKSLVAETKRLITDKSVANPAHTSLPLRQKVKLPSPSSPTAPSAESKKAREKALLHFQKQKAQKEANESQAMESANVSDPYLFSSNCDTDQLSDCHGRSILRLFLKSLSLDMIG